MKHKLTKIMLIIITGTTILTSIFIYHDYQNNQKIINDDSPIKIVADNINDDLKLNPINPDEAFNNQYQRLSNTRYIFYNSDKKPCLPDNDANSMIVLNNNIASTIKLPKLSYDILKEISQYLLDIVSTDPSQGIDVTINYDRFENNKVETSNLSYLAINDQVFLNNSHLQTMTCQLDSFNCPFISIDNYMNYIYSYNLGIYESIEEFFNHNSKNIDQNGYYEKEFNSGMNNENNTFTSSLCIQELSGKYSKHTNLVNKLNDNYHNSYLAWFQINGIYEKYNFINYLTDHYYNIIIPIIFILLSFLSIKKIIGKEIKSPVTASESLPIELPTNNKQIDIEPIITNLINTSHNVLLFKKIKITYQPKPALISGNQEQLTKLITDLFNFALKYSNDSELSITLSNQGISFTNNNFTYNNNDLNELNDCLEIITAYNYQHVLNEHCLSFTNNV